MKYTQRTTITNRSLKKKKKKKNLVSKETVVLRRWEIETEIYFIKRVDKGRMATVKDLES